MSIEWDSLILGGNELNTVGPATENARRANSVRNRGMNSRGAPAERIGLAGAVTVNSHGDMAAWTSSAPCGSEPRSCT